MPVNQYEVGSTVRLSVLFTDLDGNPVDPQAVTASILTPGALAPTPLTVITKTSTGNYHADFLVVDPGIHRYKFIGSGGLNAASEAVFTAAQSF